MRVGGRLAQFLEDPQAIGSSPGSAKEVPHQGAEPGAHHVGVAREALLINRTSPATRSSRSLPSECDETFGRGRQAEDVVLEGQARTGSDPELLDLPGPNVDD